MQFTSLESAKSGGTAGLAAGAGQSRGGAPQAACPGFAFVSVEPALLLDAVGRIFRRIGTRHRRCRRRPSRPAAQRFLALMLRSFARGSDCGMGAGVADRTGAREAGNQSAPGAARRPRTNRSSVLKFTVEFGARSGRIDWLLPGGPARPDPRGARRATAAQRRCASRRPGRPCSPSALQDAQLDTRAVLAQAQISLRELVRLSPGDIIPIEAPQQVTLLAGDVPLYRGRFGVSQGRNALKILPGAST